MLWVSGIVDPVRSVTQHTEMCVRVVSVCVVLRVWRCCSQRDSLDSFQVEMFQKYG